MSLSSINNSINQALSSDNGNGTTSTWWARTLDPKKVEMQYNSAEAIAQRNWEDAQARITRDYNSQEARLQREWEENMSNTAYQRSVEDMRKAGLNPYLAYSNGGASTPSGATASATTPTGSASSVHFGQSPLIPLMTTIIGSAFGLAKSAIIANGLKSSRVPYSSTKIGFGR